MGTTMQEQVQADQSALPKPLDTESLSLLRAFLGPILETSPTWRDLANRLGQKGYGLAFREGRLVILSENGTAVCTGRSLGVPLSEIAARLGRPRLQLDRSGRSGTLDPSA